MISNNSKNSLYQNLLNNKDESSLRVEKEGSNNMNATLSQIMNKRAQSLYMSREEESNFDGLIKKNDSSYLRSIVEFQASLVETK